MNKVKQFTKALLKYLHLDLTLNMQYDRQTALVIKRVLKADSYTVDVGCHKGEMLEQFIKLAPQGNHIGFEPIPEMYEELKNKFANNRVQILPYALADKEGKAEFNYVKNAPAYSGLKKRDYAIGNPEIQKIEVELRTLDQLIPNSKVDFIKIDVEGAEMGVLRGAKNVILKNKPVIIFECGLGASEFYGTKPEEVYQFICNDCGMKLSTMKNWLSNQTALTNEEFCKKYTTRKDYYFIAYN